MPMIVGPAVLTISIEMETTLGFPISAQLHVLAGPERDPDCADLQARECFPTSVAASQQGIQSFQGGLNVTQGMAPAFLSNQNPDPRPK